MASALPGDYCVGQHSVCIVRAALLDTDCTPLGGADSAIVSAGIVTATAAPEFVDGASFEPTNGCGDIAWTYETADKVRRYNVSGELTYFDHEAFSLLFGGSLIVGDTGTAFVGDNIGWASPWYTDDAPPPAIYLEFIVKVAGAGIGDCTGASSDLPAAVGKIFPKVKLVPGDQTMEFDAATMPFDGFSVNNPNIGAGPWNDFPGTGGIPNTGYLEVSYGLDEYEAIADLAGCGFQTLPT